MPISLDSAAFRTYSVFTAFGAVRYTSDAPFPVPEELPQPVLPTSHAGHKILDGGQKPFHFPCPFPLHLDANCTYSAPPCCGKRLQELKDFSSNIARFIENAKRYSEIPELTSENPHIFIRRVEVGERAEKYPRTAPQKVRIHYRDVGLVDKLPRSIADAVTQ